MKLQDYLHYYIGCAYWTDNSEGELNSKTLPHVIDMLNRGKKVQLHLNRLEDMTEEQAIELTRLVVHSEEYINVSTCRNSYNDIIVTWGLLTPLERVNDNEHRYNATAERCWGAKQFHYLLQHHFDLFGLIDAGLAIDAKTIKG